ncbi:MAG: ribosome small subunit-dependent GTPase A [Verrucomicrobia bacterium]|nr:ribosome small subunit-dependent GTPase A [Verrucomicrobiota bacterium]
MSDSVRQGTVERVDATLSRVRVGDEVLDCTVRRKLVKFAKGEKTVVVGDRVVVEQTDRGEWIIKEVAPRRSQLARPGFRGRTERVIVANVDELVIVAAAADPDYRTGLIDRYLVIAERTGLPAVIGINKIDLVDGDGRRRIEQALGFYADIGSKIFYVSALDGTGLDELRAQLTGKESVLCGHSGVGKSSLINRLIPGVDLGTREVSDVTGRGRHMTSAVTMLALPGGGYIVDTPGIREFGLIGIRRDELWHYFREFVAYDGQCRFHNCVHINEPGCAIKAALDEGKIQPSRYDSYQRLYEELPATDWELGN